MEQITLGELYHIVMMITGVWAMVVSIIYLIAFTQKEKRKQYYNYRNKRYK